ncbi:MAG: flagellar hook-length control protein FliK [Pseudomonadota bacterium]|nr:flagellar hook-length control protein FliK [Pseudomonadota bacterium]
MTSILTSAQHTGVTDHASMSSNRLDSVSSKADKLLFNKTYSKNIAFKYRESERLADEADTTGNFVPPVGRHLPVEEVEHSQALRLSSDQNASTDTKSLKLAESLQAKTLLGMGQQFQSLSSSTPSAISIDAFGSAFANASSSPDGGLATLLINNNGMADIDIKESVLNINTRLTPSIDLRSASISHNTLHAPGTSSTSLMFLPISHPQWGSQFEQRMSWLVGQNISRAEIHLNPPELGALQVRIDQRQDTTLVFIVSQNATTRELLESNASRLKELFSDHGLELLDVEVNDGEEQSASADPYRLADLLLTGAVTDERLSAESNFMANKEAVNISGIILRYGAVDTFV